MQRKTFSNNISRNVWGQTGAEVEIPTGQNPRQNRPEKCANPVDLKTMLQIEYLLAEVGFDPAENEPSKIW